MEDRLRRCCKLLRAFSPVRKACCYEVQQPRRTLTGNQTMSGKDRREKLRQGMAAAEKESTVSNTAVKLRLLVAGMDCSECAPNVTRALVQLPSVTPTGLDYFNATADLTFDPDVLSAEAITRYVARATGFTVEGILGSAGSESNNMSLPFYFLGQVPERVLNCYTVVKRKQPAQSYDVTFVFRGPQAKLPREVAAFVLEHGGRLVPSSETKTRDTTSRDALRIALRFAISTLLCIPTLVFAWADLPGPRTRWTSAALGLTTLIFINAWPLMSSSLRSLIYLRRTDLLLLVTISIVVAYAYSVVSFALLQAGVYASEPFFETIALLVTLIYCGRTVQAITRRSVASSAGALRKIQRPTVLLCGDKEDEEREEDVR